METGNKILLEIKSKIVKNKKDILVALVIFLISLIFFKNFLGTETLMANGHHLHEQTFFAYNYKTALEKNTLPFWTPYWYSGQPLFGDSQVFFVNLTFIFTILFKNIFLAINLSTLFYFFISGLGMYILVKNLTGLRTAAFISSLIYMFNGLIYDFIVQGNPSILEPYALIPLVFFFVIKATKAKNPIFYSALAGILMAFQIFSGGGLILIYTGILIGAYLTFNIISKNFKKNFIKTLIIGFLIILFLVGLSAIKLFPSSDFMKKTNRGQGLSYQEYIGSDYFIFSDFLKIIPLNKSSSSIRVHIGIVAFLLALLSFGLWRKKMVLFFLSLSVFILFLSSGGVLAELFYKYAPVFPQTRHIGRVLFIFVFSSSVLAGYGFSYASGILTKKIKIWNKIKNFIFIIIVLLIMTELVFAKGLPKGFNIIDQLEENELAKYLEQQDEKFRITTFDVTDFISFYASSYYAQYGLETLSGGGGIWFNDFIKYLAIARTYNNPKLLGILNLKYATSTEKVDVPGFKEVRKFEECVSCISSGAGWTYWIAGPYLYENENFLPRYYFVNNSMLVVGENQQSEDIIYTILLNRNFNPKTTVIIQGKNTKINDYDSDFLKNFDAIIITANSIDSNSFSVLQRYKDSGGKIFPDILNNKNSLDFSEIENTLNAFEGKLVEVDSESISPNEILLKPKDKGFLVLSEKFAIFDGWSAEKNGNNVDILKADVIISSVYVDSPGTIRFKYKPKSFNLGMLVSLITLSIIFIYGLFFLRRKWVNITKA
ncbi:MAG: hypothetical protein IH934_05535 [Nanoarchaeota archaeon]|nr:hypothetical protein [Nanoarchaeota archaeon]